MSFESRPLAGQPRREGRRRRAAVFSRRPPPWVHPLTAHAHAHTHTHTHTHTHAHSPRVCAHAHAPMHTHALDPPTHPPTRPPTRARAHAGLTRTRTRSLCGQAPAHRIFVRLRVCVFVLSRTARWAAWSSSRSGIFSSSEGRHRSAHPPCAACASAPRPAVRHLALRCNAVYCVATCCLCGTGPVP
jgi:hypothetical protein